MQGSLINVVPDARSEVDFCQVTYLFLQFQLVVGILHGLKKREIVISRVLQGFSVLDVPNEEELTILLGLQRLFDNFVAPILT